MKFGHFYIDRPRFAAVISILIVIIGALSFTSLPITQYPEIAPPTIVVNATYPGASPQVIADTVATPIEQEINGVENMLYMTSQSTSDGAMQLTITFEQGTDLDTAQVLVQNRIAKAEPKLPEEVRRLGVIAQKSSPDFIMVVHLLSPDNSLDELYISNYALLNVRDQLARIDGIGELIVFGAREYSMRVWLNPERLAALELAASDVVASLQAQNIQVAGGKLGQPPMPMENAFQYTVTAQGRFKTPDQFRDVIIKQGEDGRLTRLGDVARIEIGGRDYVRNSYLNGKNAVAIGIFQRPGSNALETSDQIIRTMEEQSKTFPPGIEYRIVYNPTEFISQSVKAVYMTIFEAVILVVLVIIVFLQSWRAAVIPIVAIPVSLIGTFAVMAAMGYSLNSLTLYGMVLSIGIVVDDAIVVVEDIQRNLEKGLDPREAARVTMTEVGSALVSMGLVLVAVFIPTAFLGGIPGQFFKQFALTISVATIISVFNSLTLSPALGRILLRAPRHINNGDSEAVKPNFFFRAFNFVFDHARERYVRLIRILVRRPVIMMSIFLILIGCTYIMFQKVPGGFIPQQDQGYLIVSIELPKGAYLIFLAVADEEGGGQYGAKWLVDNVPEKIKADYLISEFGGAILTDLSGKKKIALMNAEKSPGWTRLSISGEPGHASVPYKSKNTIFMASQIIENIRKSPPEIVITNAYQEFLTGLDLSWLQNKLLTTPFTIDFTLNKLANENPAAASTLHALTRMTVTPTKMTAGNKTNIIPDELTIDFDIRLLPDQDWDYIKNYFNSVIPKEFSDNTKLSKILVDATTADSFDTPLVEAMTDLTNQLIPGYPVVPLFLPAVTDARVFRKLGITCYGYCLLGERMPTDLISKLAHGDDERIPVESLQLSHEFFKLLPEFFWKQ